MTNPSYQAGYNGQGTPPGGSSTQWQLGDAQRQQDQFYADLARRHREEQAKFWADQASANAANTTSYGGPASASLEEIGLITLLALGLFIGSFALLALFIGGGGWAGAIFLACLAAVVFPIMRLVGLNAPRPADMQPDTVAEARSERPGPKPWPDDLCPIPIHLMARNHFAILEWGQPNVPRKRQTRRA